MSDRLSWDQYFLGLAKQVSTRATCKRLKVGAVLVKDKRVIATGYNGSLPGQPHCNDEGCLKVNGCCWRTIHAEQNALLQCCRQGIVTEGATIYVTHLPCFACLKLLIQAGIQEIVFSEHYQSYTPEVIKHAQEMTVQSGITLRQIEEANTHE